MKKKILLIISVCVMVMMLCSCSAKDVTDAIDDVNNHVNTFVWEKLGLVLILGTGVIVTVLTFAFQFTRIGHWMKNTVGSLFKKDVISHSNEKKSISQFQALCTALAATIGVGNIAGVAVAIISGGPGAIFWMWVAALLGMMTSFAENILGVYYRRINKEGEWSGGAMYYLTDGLGKKKGCKMIGKILAIAFSIFTLLASFGIGNLSQVNAITKNVQSSFGSGFLNGNIAGINIFSLIIGLTIAVIIGFVVIGGVKRVASVAEKVVPTMVVLFVIGSFIVIGVNFKNVGPAFSSIFRCAFGTKAVAGGVTGFALSKVITQGVKRGVFSNEAGLGSSVMINANSDVKEPVKQGMWGIFEIFADTIIVCSMTALVVLTSGVVDLNTGVLTDPSLDKVTVVGAAFNTVFKIGGVSLGSIFVTVALSLFAFTTILGWVHYGSKAFGYLFGDKGLVFYKVFFTILIVVGAITNSDFAINLSDTFNGLMLVPNLIGVLVLTPLVVKITKNYIDRNIKKKDIRPMLSYDPKLEDQQIAELRKEIIG